MSVSKRSKFENRMSSIFISEVTSYYSVKTFSNYCKFSFTTTTKKIIKLSRKHFVCFAAFVLYIQFPPRDSSPVQQKLCLCSLSDRRQFTNLSFFPNILSDRTNYPSLLSFILPSK